MNALTILLAILIFLIFVTIGFLGYEWNKYNLCATKEHSTCPIYNCTASDNHPYGKDGIFCELNAFRIDDDGNKYCSGV